MPYASISQLPKPVKDTLPKHAQRIFLGAFNSAMQDGKSETVAFKIAWGAVKASYRQIGGEWKKKAFTGLGKMLTTPDYTAGPPMIGNNGKKKPKKKKLTRV